jgi:hypothetical protein
MACVLLQAFASHSMAAGIVLRGIKLLLGLQYSIDLTTRLSLNFSKHAVLEQHGAALSVLSEVRLDCLDELRLLFFPSFRM